MKTAIALAAAARPRLSLPSPAPSARAAITIVSAAPGRSLPESQWRVLATLLPSPDPPPAVVGDIRQRRPPRQADHLAELGALEEERLTVARIHRKLDTMRIDLAFEQAPYEEVMAFIRDFSGLNIIRTSACVRCSAPCSTRSTPGRISW